MRVGTSMCVDVGQLRLPRRRARPATSPRGSMRAVEMDLQGANAGGEIEDARQAGDSACRCSISACARKRRLRSSTSGPYSTSRCLSPAWRYTTPDLRRRCGNAMKDGVGHRPATARPLWLARVPAEMHVGYAQVGEWSCPGALPARAPRPSRSGENDGVAGFELPHLPQFRLNDGGGADKAAQAGAVRAQDDRHVAGEIHGADGIGVVVDIGGMQARFAAVAARPLGLGPIRRTPVRLEL